MKIYLAARYTRREELQIYAGELNGLGHEITSRWLQGAHQISDADLLAGKESLLGRRFAEEDLEDLLCADCCISFTEPPRSMNSSRGGRHVEFGIALALHKLCIVVGDRENVFHFLPNVSIYPTWLQALRALRSQCLEIDQ